MLTDSQTEKKTYDKRTHEERVSDLKEAFSELKVEAVVRGSKNIASAAQVLIKANVNKTYFYTHKIKDESIQKQYHDIRDTIKAFQDSFQENNDQDSALAKAYAKADKEAERAEKCEHLIEKSREEIAHLRIKLKQKDNLLQNSEIRMIDSANQVSQLRQASSTRGVVNFTSAKIVSPDHYLTVNGRYDFDDENLRFRAWERSYGDLSELLQRELPTRVYVLIGPPCSGKTSWCNNESSFSNDRHSIVIDSTNLTQTDRMQWFMIINKYILSRDVKTCAVVFDTPVDVLLSRNNLRDLSKKMDDSVIIKKSKKMVWPDLRIEKFDEMKVIRHG